MTPYYEHAGIRIFHGDCLDILPLECGLVLTDPPYGFAYESGFASSWSNTQIANDADTSARDQALRMLSGVPAVVFGSWKRQRPQNTRAVLIWDKGAAFGMGDLSFPWKNSFEEIYIIGDGFRSDRRDEGVLRGFWVPFAESQGRRHPNEKPLTLFSYLLAHHVGSPVLDPFMGSGTTLEACKREGRQAIGIEIEERYCEIAAKRLAQEVLEFA